MPESLFKYFEKLWNLAPWIVLPALFFFGRLGAIVGHYCFNTPHGNPIVADWTQFLPLAIVTEIGVFFTLVLIFHLCYHYNHKYLNSSKIERSISYTFIIFALIYIVLAQVDLELKRWIGQRLNLALLYKSATVGQDPDLFSKILLGDIPAVTWAINCVFTPAILGILWLIKAKPDCIPSSKNTLTFLAIAVICLPVKLWWQPEERVWHQVRPALYELSASIYHKIFKSVDQQKLERGIIYLKRQIKDNDSSEYPLWHHTNNEQESISTFKKQSLKEKPDVILIIVESLRGWTADFRNPQLKNLAPNLYDLWKTRGKVFPFTHAQGFPSAEGLMNIHLGIWSHPQRVFLTDHVRTSTRSFTEILGQAGYYRTLLTGSDPNYDNLPVWLRYWYDEWHYSSEYIHDIPLARRFIEIYEKAPKDRPKFMTLITISTHTPYQLPIGKTPDDPKEAYLRAFSYTDRALGMVLSHLKRSPRWKNTMIIVTGDHSQPNGWHFSQQKEIGAPNIGHTWTTLLISAPGKTIAGTIDKSLAAHVDLAPTLLDLLNIKACHHFMGRNLLATSEGKKQTYSFLFGGVAISEVNIRYQLHLTSDFMGKFRYGHDHFRQTEEKLSKEEIVELKKVYDMVYAYAYLLDNNRLRPKD